jgi:hypothetical protein
MNLQRNILIKPVGRASLLFFFDEDRYGVYFRIAGHSQVRAQHLLDGKRFGGAQ